MQKIKVLCRSAFAIGCLFLGSAPADAISGCEFKIEPGTSTLRVLTLSASAYACMTASDYRDVRVLNGDGNPVPISIHHPSEKGEVVDIRRTLEFYVDHVDTNRRYHEHLRQIMHHSGYIPNGVSYDSWSKRHNYPASIIVENPHTEDRLNRLQIDIEDHHPGGISAYVYLQYSNDLSRWSSSSASQQLFYLGSQNGLHSRTQLRLGANRQPRYVRVVILSNIPDFAESITRLEGMYERTQIIEPEYVWTEATSIQMLGNGQDWQFSVADQLPVSRLRFQPENGIVYFAGLLMSKPIQNEVPEDNAYLGLRERNKKKLKDTLKRIVNRPGRSFESINSGWDLLTRFSQLHFRPADDDTVAGNDDLTVPEPIHFRHQASRHWRITFDHPSAAMIATRFPMVEFGWTAAQVRFLAQGPEPFVLQTGVSNDSPRPAASEALWSRYAQLESVALNPELNLVEGQTAPTIATAAISKPMIIWFILITGVLVMAYMAWQLLRSIKNTVEEDG
jgi:hypothetical protein